MSDLPPSNEPPAAAHAFDCPLCGGAFEVDAEWLGKTIPCPHCGDDIELPAPAVTATVPAPSAAPIAEPPRRRTIEERAALRRKVNLTLAIAGALLLISVFVVLAQFG